MAPRGFPVMVVMTVMTDGFRVCVRKRLALCWSYSPGVMIFFSGSPVMFAMMAVKAVASAELQL